MGLMELSYNVHGWRQGSVWLIQGLLGEELDHRDNYTPLSEMFFWIRLNAEMKAKQSFCPWTFRKEKTVPPGCSYSSTTLDRLQEIWRRQDLEKSLESVFIGIKKINEAGGWFPSLLDSKAHGSTLHALASQVASLPPTSWMFGVMDVWCPWCFQSVPKPELQFWSSLLQGPQLWGLFNGLSISSCKGILKWWFSLFLYCKNFLEKKMGRKES